MRDFAHHSAIKADLLQTFKIKRVPLEKVETIQLLRSIISSLGRSTLSRAQEAEKLTLAIGQQHFLSSLFLIKHLTVITSRAISQLCV